MEKYLIVGLGNPGPEYHETRHNVGWMAVKKKKKSLEKENIPNNHLLVIVDDKDLPLGKFRLRGKGSGGSHNGLGHIQQLIGQDYARLRIGIGSDFSRGQQVDYVLGKFSDEEKTTLSPVFDTSQEIIKSFVLAGVDVTMNQFNRK